MGVEQGAQRSTSKSSSRSTESLGFARKRPPSARSCSQGFRRLGSMDDAEGFRRATTFPRRVMAPGLPDSSTRRMISRQGCLNSVIEISLCWF